MQRRLHYARRMQLATRRRPNQQNRTQTTAEKPLPPAFKGHGSLKHCVVVDEDINIYDPTRCGMGNRHTLPSRQKPVILSNQPGSSLDPSGDFSEGKKATTAKAGLDATAPLVTTGKGFNKEDYVKVDLNKYL